MAESRQSGPVPGEESERRAASSSNAPLIVILVLVGLVMLGAIAYAFMMQIPGSMPGMNH